MMLEQRRSTGDDSLPLAGYYNGLKQWSATLKTEISCPDAVDISMLTGELKERFEIEVVPIRTRITRQLAEEESKAQQFLWLTIELTCNLLRTIKIPCLAPGLIQSISVTGAATNRFFVSFQVPTVRHCATSWIGECFSRAYRLLILLADCNRPETDVGDFLEDLHENFVVGARKQIFGGESTIPLLTTALKLDIPFMHTGRGVYQLGWGARKYLSDRSTTNLDSAIGSKISRDKIWTADLLRTAGLPAPFHYLAKTPDEAVDAANRIGFPVVIKPADRERGEGVTVGIEDAGSAMKAFGHASKFSKNILVERHVPGVCHRILIAENTHLYTVARLPKSIEGDGIRTVRDLMLEATKNEGRKAKHLRLRPFTFDEITEQSLQQHGLNFESIPEKGTLVFLRPIQSNEWGGTPRLVTAEIHPENIRIAIQAAQLLDLNVAGVDLISDDISKPWYETGAVINEVNFAPFLGDRFDYQRNGVERLMRSLFKRDSRIPVEAFIGDKSALAAAHHRQQALANKGIRAFVTTHQQTFDASCEIRLASPAEGLFGRCNALLMNQDVEALLIVIQTDEFLSTGLPVDSIDKVSLINRRLEVNKTGKRPDHPDRVAMIMNMLRPYLRAKSDAGAPLHATSAM